MLLLHTFCYHFIYSNVLVTSFFFFQICWWHCWLWVILFTFIILIWTNLMKENIKVSRLTLKMRLDAKRKTPTLSFLTSACPWLLNLNRGHAAVVCKKQCTSFYLNFQLRLHGWLKTQCVFSHIITVVGKELNFYYSILREWSIYFWG